MGSAPPQFAGSDNPAADSASWLTRGLTFAYLPLLNVRMLIDPRVLSYDWSMDAIPLVTRVTDKRNLASLAFYAGLLCLLKRVARFTMEERREKVEEMEMMFRKFTSKLCHHRHLKWTHESR